jgi:hypothetical protein
MIFKVNAMKKKKYSANKSQKFGNMFVPLSKSEKKELEKKREQAKSSLTSDSELEAMTTSQIRDLVRQRRGRYINYIFSCSICGQRHSIGHVYRLGPLEREVCKFCENEILKKNSGSKLIYIAMGNKK